MFVKENDIGNHLTYLKPFSIRMPILCGYFLRGFCILKYIMKKYKQNLRVENNKVFSYETHVATINGDELHQLGYWSVTTQKHINYVANELNLELKK